MAGKPKNRPARAGRLRPLVAIALLVVIAGCGAPRPAADTSPTTVGFADPALPVPDNAGDRDYLGLSSGQQELRLSQIRAQVVLVEVFSMYCPYCHREAPLVNDLYRRIGNDPEMAGKVKLIGVGRGNTAFEVRKFKEKYQVPFPLFPDEDRTISNGWNIRRTPTFTAWKIVSPGPPELLLRHEGQIGDLPEFINTLRIFTP